MRLAEPIIPCSLIITCKRLWKKQPPIFSIGLLLHHRAAVSKTRTAKKKGMYTAGTFGMANSHSPITGRPFRGLCQNLACSLFLASRRLCHSQSRMTAIFIQRSWSLIKKMGQEMKKSCTMFQKHFAFPMD